MKIEQMETWFVFFSGNETPSNILSTTGYKQAEDYFIFADNIDEQNSEKFCLFKSDSLFTRDSKTLVYRYFYKQYS